MLKRSSSFSLSLQFCSPTTSTVSAVSASTGGLPSLERLFLPPPPPPEDLTGVADFVQLLPPLLRPPQPELPPDAQPVMCGCSMWPLPQSTAETPGT